MVIINKDAQAKFISALIILIITALVVIAVNETFLNNSSEVNQSYNVSLNESVNFTGEFVNQTEPSDINDSQNNTVINQTEELNQTNEETLQILEEGEIKEENYIRKPRYISSKKFAKENGLKINQVNIWVDDNFYENIVDKTIIFGLKEGSEIKVKVYVENVLLNPVYNVITKSKIEKISQGENIRKSLDPLDLEPAEKKTIIFDYVIPSDIEKDSYDLDINIEGNDDNGEFHIADFSIKLEFEDQPERQFQEKLINITKPAEFADTINDVLINSPEPERFMSWEKNYSRVQFKNVTSNKVFSKLYTKNKEDHIRGYIINAKKYAIHIIDCDEETQSCFFRINGVNTRDITNKQNNRNIPTEFRINDKIELKIDNIQFNFCDNKRFCDYYYEAYDIVDFSLEVSESE